MHRGALAGDGEALPDSHAGAVTGLAISPNGNLIASCGGDGSIIVRDASCKAIATICGNSPVNSIAFDPSSRWLASGHAEGRLRFWMAASGEEAASDIAVARPIHELAFGAADDLLAVSDGQTVALWEVKFAEESAKGTLRKTLTLAEGTFTSLAFTPRSRELLTGDTTGATRLWNTSGGSGRVVARKHDGGVTSIAVAPRSETVLTAGAGGDAWLWEAGTPDVIQPLASIAAHPNGARYVALSLDGQRMISDGYDNHVRVWDLSRGVQERDLAAAESASACALFPKGTQIAVGHWNKRIHVSDVASGKRAASYPGLPHGPYVLAVSPDERRLAAVFREHGVMLFDLASLEADPVVSLTPEELPFTSVAFAPDGASFVTCTGDHERMTLPGKVRLRSAKNGAVVRSFDGHTSEVKFAAFDAEGKRLATTSADKTVRLWDVESATLLATLPHSIGTFAAEFVPNSDLLFTSDYHGTLLLWDLTSNQVVQQISCHADLLGRVALSHDLTVVATSSRDGTVKLWKLAGKGNESRVVDASARNAAPGPR
jgi:WD40 repeat protein